MERMERPGGWLVRLAGGAPDVSLTLEVLQPSARPQHVCTDSSQARYDVARNSQADDGEDGEAQGLASRILAGGALDVGLPLQGCGQKRHAWFR